MKETERLDLLKEIAGTKVYDDRRSESEKILKEAEGKKAKINETLEYIQNRLTELEEERNELKEYQDLDRRRRALEYTIYDQDLTTAMEELRVIEEKRSAESTKASDVHTGLFSAQNEIRRLDREVKRLQSEATIADKERSFLEEERQDAIKDRVRLELEIADASAKIERDVKRQQYLQQELTNVTDEIANAEQELASVQPRFEEIMERERQDNEKLVDLNRRTAELYSKQGRKAQFKTKSARDKFLTEQIDALNKERSVKKKQAQEMDKDIEEFQERIDRDKETTDASSDNVRKQRKRIEDISEDLNKQKKLRDDLFNQRKALWRHDSEADTIRLQYRDEIYKAERQLESTMNKVVSTGLAFVRKLKREGRQGIYGPIIELFDCGEEAMTAVEVTAGNALFFVVVDNDTTASKILDEMNKAKMGRVTFVPLNVIQPKVAQFPEAAGVSPLINMLNFDPKYRKAFEQVFGKTLLCQDIEMATNFSKSKNIDCITFDGDQVNRKGALTGGYYDTRHSRLQAQAAIQLWRSRLAEVDEKTSEGKQKLGELDQSINQVLEQMQKLEKERNTITSQLEQAQLDNRVIVKNLETLQDGLAQKQQIRAALDLSIKQTKESAQALTNEKNSAFDANLSEEEQEELNNLNQSAEGLKRALIDSSQLRNQLESRKSTLTSQLNSNLKRRKDQIEEELIGLAIDAQKRDRKENKTEYQSVENTIETTTNQIAVKDNEISSKRDEIARLEQRVESHRSEENKQNKALQKESEEMERLLNRRGIVLQKKETAEKKIKDIGSIPVGEVEALKGKKSKALMKDLHDTNVKLKGFGNVNKKALDQYMQFTEKRDELFGRNEELETGEKSIRELIQHLDHQKDEAIERTFKGVSKHFKDVFQELVPTGEARLMLRGRQEGGSINDVVGVKVVVSMTGNGESATIEQLSGGQKSLVALALIFAIQRCDPAPFYLFDEIDSALDTTHRTAVGQMIRKQSKTKTDDDITYVQFICSTFKPELVKIADRCYAVSTEGKASRVDDVAKDDAIRIIETEIQEAEEAGEDELSQEASQDDM
eukprot:TRINITY_DN7035_c0_g1_i1.p1 TRINITY_DN7035_c0_g1~~TRINITY_DN7035_c0_g1_i1.p1  ORF type:complete len:1217 (+),score=488.18 TRINITY_DN7035_c0_g1_i1:479-3652(+)